MKIRNTSLDNVLLIEPDPVRDERGYFARVWCEEELSAAGVETRTSQCSISFNKTRGTLRGIHFQRAPHEEAKLVRCERGAIFDVAVDLRADSATYGEWFGTELSEENNSMMYIPKGFGHGFQTLVDDSSVYYQISEPYVQDAGSGYRFDDPKIDVQWPLAVTVISDKDRSWPVVSMEGLA